MTLEQKCINGDSIAQNELYKQYHSIVNSFVRKLLQQTDITEIKAINNNIFYQVFKNIHTFKNQCSLKTWILTIAKNNCIENMRQKYKKRQLEFIRLDESIEAVKEDSQIDIEKIYTAIDKLSMDKRVVIVLNYMNGLTISKIAKLLKQPEGTIKSRIFHARKDLQNFLKSNLL